MNSLLRTALLSIVPISALLIASAGCVASTDEGDVDQDFDEAETMHTGVMHAMPVQIASIQSESAIGSQSAVSKKLTNYGGPVLKNVNVVPVYWNATVANQGALTAFYANITSSTYFDMLSQYSAIGYGTAQAGVVAGNNTTTITDAQIQSQLNAMFTAGSIPAPNANNYYAIHFPKNASITASDGTKACVQWCGYHGTYVRNGVNVNYGVMPDMASTGCNGGGCGPIGQDLNNETSVASHELVEATTDPGVGLATTYSPPLAWYNATYGEIGDICNGQQKSVVANGVTYTVQKQFSNSANACK